MAERDLAAELDALRLKLDMVEGQALAAEMLQTRLLLALVGVGVLVKEHAEVIVDQTLLVMEGQTEAMRLAGLSTEQARFRLRELLSLLARLP